MNFVLRILVALAALIVASSAHAQLQARDVNGDGATDAVYDPVYNVTWLADMNYARTSGYDADGRMNWYDAVSWVDQLEFAGYSDWRMASTLNADGQVAPADNELWSLFFYHLGTPLTPQSWAQTVASPYATENRALFTNIVPYSWFGTPWGAPPHLTQGAFLIETTTQGWDTLHWATGAWPIPELYAVALRNGDVAAPIPEPSTYALMLVGLAAVGYMARRRKGAEPLAA